MRRLTILCFIFAVALAFPVKVLAGNPLSQSNSGYGLPSNQTPANGSTTATITINLRDAGNLPVSGDVITLSTTDSAASFPQNSQTSDSSGNVTFTMSSTTIGTDQITANIIDPSNGSNDLTFTNWFNVTFYSSSGCSSVPAAPVLTSVVSNSDHQATLTWTDSANPVSNYLISYGVVSKNYIYGDPNVGGQGTTTFTVGSLSSNKKYYFVVAASNNCGASPFSSEMFVIANPIPTSPPTPISTSQPTSTPATVVVVSNSNPTDTPEETLETPTAQANTGSGNSTIKNLAIIFLVSGFVIIVLLFVIIRIGKKKNPPTIPPITFPDTPSSPPPLVEPGENPQQQQK